MGRSKLIFNNAVPLHDLTSGFGPYIYNNLDNHVKSSVIKSIILKARNTPSSRTRLHVIVSPGNFGIHPGDVGTLDRNLALELGRNTMPDGFKVHTKSVPAQELFTDGDFNKWTWTPGKE